MESTDLEENPGQGVQAPTADLQSQSTGQRQVSPQASAAVNQVLVWTASGCSTGDSGQSRQTHSGGRWCEEPTASAAPQSGSVVEPDASSTTLATDLDSKAREG